MLLYNKNNLCKERKFILHLIKRLLLPDLLIPGKITIIIFFTTEISDNAFAV